MIWEKPFCCEDQSPALPNRPAAHCHESPPRRVWVPGRLCLWDGKEEGWKTIPAPPVLTHCLSRSAQAWRLLANAEGRLLLRFSTRFWCFAPNLCLVPHNCACKADQPVRLSCSWMMLVGQEADRPREFQLHVHGPCPSLLPGWCGVRWGRQMSPPSQAVTAGGTQPKANGVCKVTRASVYLGEVSWKKGGPGASLQHAAETETETWPSPPCPYHSRPPTSSDPFHVMIREGWAGHGPVFGVVWS